MEFGRVEEHLLNSIDFSLPAEPAANKQILPGKAKNNAKVYIGATVWSRKEWVGKIYPQKVAEKDMLKHYVQHYNCIELNATHYKIYSEANIARWAAQAEGKDFKFCPKLYQGITHWGNLKGKNDLVGAFLQGIMAFEEKLGPIFLQMSDAFSPNRKQELFDFMASLPVDLDFFLEVRHPAWFSDAQHFTDMCQFLSSRKMGLVITDTAGRRDCAHLHLTIPKAFIRYVGNSLHPSDYARIDNWVAQLHKWLKSGIEEIFFFTHMYDEGTTPALGVYLVDKMNAACGLDLIKPKFVMQQKDLFG
jgi:uncharacterized protein YecE (DUF72 family)